MSKPEAKILARVKKQAKAHGLGVIRLTLRQGVEVGWPDLIILGPYATVLFVETKAPGQPLRPIQRERRRVIAEVYGHAYAKPDSIEAVDHMIERFATYCVALARENGDA